MYKNNLILLLLLCFFSCFFSCCKKKPVLYTEKSCWNYVKYEILNNELHRIHSEYVRYNSLYISEKNWDKKLRYSDTCDMLNIKADEVYFLMYGNK